MVEVRVVGRDGWREELDCWGRETEEGGDGRRVSILRMRRGNLRMLEIV